VCVLLAPFNCKSLQALLSLLHFTRSVALTLHLCIQDINELKSAVEKAKNDTVGGMAVES
jgi:hypothetical protein